MGRKRKTSSSYEALHNHLEKARNKLHVPLSCFRWIEDCPVGYSEPLFNGQVGRGIGICKAFSRDPYRSADLVLIAMELALYEFQSYYGFQIDEEIFVPFAETIRDCIAERRALRLEDNPLFTSADDDAVPEWRFVRPPSRWHHPGAPGLPSSLRQNFYRLSVDPGPVYPLSLWEVNQNWLLNRFTQLLNDGDRWSRTALKLGVQVWVEFLAFYFGCVETHKTYLKKQQQVPVFELARSIHFHERAFIERWVDLVAARYPVNQIMSATGQRTLRWE